MAINHDDFTEIKRVLDDRYVRIDECNNNQEKVNKKFAKDDKRISLIMHDFGIIKKLMWAIASTGVGTLVATFLQLILK